MSEAKVIKNPVRAIRAFCVQCMGSPYETNNCPSSPGSQFPCPLYPFRQGKNPYREKKDLSEEERALLADRLRENLKRAPKQQALLAPETHEAAR